MATECIFADIKVEAELSQRGPNGECYATQASDAHDCCFRCARELIQTQRRFIVTEELPGLPQRTPVQKAKIGGLASALEKH